MLLRISESRSESHGLTRMRAEQRHTSCSCAATALLVGQALCGCSDDVGDVTVTGPAGARVTLSRDSRQTNVEIPRNIALTFAPLDRVTPPPAPAGRAVSATYALTYSGRRLRPTAMPAPLDVFIPYDSKQLRASAPVVLLRSELPAAASWVPDPLATVRRGFVITRATRPSLFLVVTPTP
jgi:hypothetical protein